jgi:magnesium-protoporphyrin IX monomethyl ester (oxidative) cyclase
LIDIGKPMARVGELGEELEIDANVELDYEPFLHTLKNNFPTRPVKPTLLFETSRGCWWGARAHCTFCGLNGGTMNYRAMSPQLAIEQFHALFKYASECSDFQCVDNIMPKNYVKEVFPFLKTPQGADIFYEVKADLSEEDLQVMAKTGVRSIQPGIESLATSTLKLMRKGTTAFHNLRLLKHCVTYEINPSWNLLIGFPGEGADVYQKYIQDIPLLTHLIPPSGAFPVRFDRFSPYFVQAEGYGLNLHPMDFYNLTYPFSPESLANLAYYFTDHNFRAEYFTTMLKWVGKIREKIDSWTAKWTTTDGLRQPKLYFKDHGGADLIFDSRSGQALEYRIDPLSKQVLEALDKPKELVSLAQTFNHILDFNPEKELAFLEERGLVFHETGRYLNLVHRSEPPTLNFHSSSEQSPPAHPTPLAA